MTTIALGVSHTPWVPERVESMARLRRALGMPFTPVDPMREGPPRADREFTDRAPNHEWSEQMWRWAAESDAEWGLFMQDDVIPAPNFWRILPAMLTALESARHLEADVIGFETAHPGGMTLARDGYRWYTTSDCLIGVTYAVRTSTLREAFLPWRWSGLKAGAVQKISEDSLLATFCVASNRRIYHPLPTIIDHDVSVKSTYGNDHHRHRRPSVTWRDGDVCGWTDVVLEGVGFWSADVCTAPPHLGRFYAGVGELAATWTKEYGPLEREAHERDVCPPRWAKFL